jgi:hypothetical protein
MITLLATLEQAKAAQRTNIENAMFFFFTDNIVIYFTVTAGSSMSSGLQNMVEAINKLEIELGIILVEVMHIPGTTVVL